MLLQFIEKLKNDIIAEWKFDYLGECRNIDISVLKETSLNESVTKEFVSVFLSNIAAALSTKDLLGTASEKNLKSTKSRIDISASAVYTEMINKLDLCKYTVTSEGKDESGDIIEDKLKEKNVLLSDHGLAVDVVDGTTMSAKGIGGAYTLSAFCKGLKSFPDMQAYALVAPTDIINSFPFDAAPEEAAKHLVKSLCDQLAKKPNQLKIITHSYDTGNHHQKLIDTLKNLGVDDIVIPNPVIIEAPYVLSMGMNTPDCADAMIGVFGLPEIVIATVLLASVTDSMKVGFKIASNSFLSDKSCTDLDGAFAFTEEELCILSDLDLNKDYVFFTNDIVKDKNTAFSVATSLTGDVICDVPGINTQNGSCEITSLVSGLGGAVLKIKTTHGLLNKIDYSACLNIPIDDISLVVPLMSDKFTKLIDDISHSDLSKYLNIHNADELHITLYEFGTHYGKYKGHIPNPDIDLSEDIFSYRLKNILLSDNALLIAVELDDITKQHIISKCDKCTGDFYNVKQIPSFLHVTLARINQYLSQNTQLALKEFANELNNKYSFIFGEYNGKAECVHIVKTPYEITM